MDPNHKGENLLLDYEKLKKYIEFEIIVRERRESQSTYIGYPFAPCTIEDFTSNNYEATEQFQKIIPQRICSKVPADDQNYKIKNSYENETERVSFSIQARVCD